MATTFANKLINFGLGLAVAFAVVILLLTSSSMSDRIAVTKSRKAADVDIIMNKELHYFCYFAAYTFGPTIENNPYFKSQLVDLNLKIKNDYSNHLPPNDGVALLFLFDKQQVLQHAFTLRERKGYVRWRVSPELGFNEFCASKDNVQIQLLEGNGFVLLGFK